MKILTLEEKTKILNGDLPLFNAKNKLVMNRIDQENWDFIQTIVKKDILDKINSDDKLKHIDNYDYLLKKINYIIEQN